MFLETHRQLRRQQHMVIECVPLPKDVGDMAPIYFKVWLLSKGKSSLFIFSDSLQT